MEDIPEIPAGRWRLAAVGSLVLLALVLSVLTGAVAAPRRAPAFTDRTAVLRFPPVPELINGQVIDAETQSPIAGASIQSGPREVRSDDEGRFTVASPILPLLVKAPGYGRHTVASGTSPLTVSLRPRAIKAAYLTYFGVGDRGIRNRVFELLDQTELNGVVIDVKGDRGWIPYRTRVPLALEAGAQGPLIMKEFDQMLAELKAKGIYTIARIVVFKDNVLAHRRPDWAVVDTRTGQPWLDNEGLAWMDPFREEVWDY